MAELAFIGVCIAAVFALAIYRASVWAWAAAAGAAALAWQLGLFGGPAHVVPDLVAALAWLVAAAFAALSVPEWRRRWLVAPVFGRIKQVLPRVSDTEQQALDAGTIGFDAELFSGTPDWSRLRAVAPIRLSEEERAFLDGPTEEVCRMVDDWEVRHTEREIPERIWDYVRKHGFLGMLISKEHGGLGFSPQAQSLILGKIASRSPDVCTIVMDPRAEAPLSAPAGQGRRHSLLFADGTDLGLGRRHDAGRGLCHQGRA
jgi:acyl-CoA dehydrogenase